MTDVGREWGPALHDVRHVVKMNMIWEIPFTSDARALGYLLGGWQVNAITVYQSGSPFSVICALPYPQCDFNADGQVNDRVNVNRTDLGSPSQDQWLAGVLSAADYTLPARGTLATQPRNAFVGPEYFNTDLSFFKNVSVPWSGSGNARAQLRVEMFNVFNKAQLRNPTTATNSTTFGQVTGVRDGTQPRVIQIGLKFIF
ncbi:MAG: hypothetical protein DMF89_19810 [Acidobacteria bacterium]|nr:MAG: hypothetical protein DMF89_19810 [Acidobacteriota bacterium]